MRRIIFRISLFLLFASVGVVVQGCGTHGFSKGDTTKEADRGETGKEQVQKEVAGLRTENTNLKKEIDLLKKKNKEIRMENEKEMAKVVRWRSVLSEEVLRLKGENRRIIRQNRLFEQRLRRSQQEKDLQRLKIKTLVYQAQKRLKELGYDPGPVDGIRGKNTTRAIKKFQKDNALSTTGRLDSATRNKLIRVPGHE